MRVWAAGRFPSRLRCPRAANFRGCGWHAGHGRTPARRGTGVAGWPRSTVSTAIPHTPAQSFARATGWRVGDQRRQQKGCRARLHPARLWQGGHVCAGCPDPSACVYLRKCTMGWGALAAVFSCCVADPLCLCCAGPRCRQRISLGAGGGVHGAALLHRDRAMWLMPCHPVLWALRLVVQIAVNHRQRQPRRTTNRVKPWCVLLMERRARQTRRAAGMCLYETISTTLCRPRACRPKPLLRYFHKGGRRRNMNSHCRRRGSRRL